MRAVVEQQYLTMNTAVTVLKAGAAILKDTHGFTDEQLQAWMKETLIRAREDIGGREGESDGR